MNENQRRSPKRQERQEVNGWKWAFFILLALILGLMGYLFINTQPVSVNEQETTTTAPAEETIELSTSMRPEEAEQLINAYLETEMSEDFEGHSVALTDQLEIHGEITIVGFDAPFSLYLDPYVTEDGNIQLRGEAVELSNFSLPVSAVMALIGNQMAFPPFIEMDSASQILTINLNKLSEDLDVSFEMTQIDLEEDILELMIEVDEDALENQIQRN